MEIVRPSGIVPERLSADERMNEKIEFGKVDWVVDYHEHWHDFYEWIFYRNCKVVCTLNNTEYILEDGACILLTPYDFHSTKVLESSDETYHVRILATQEACNACNLQNGYYLEKTDEFIEAALKCFECADISEREHLICAMFKHMEKYAKPIVYSGYVDETSKTVRKALEYMNTHFGASLSETAQYCNISAGYLSGIIKKYCGTTFIEIATTIRLKRAEKLLADTDMSVSQIAWSCGYNNLSHFLRVFKKETGCTPKEYRKKNKK